MVSKDLVGEIILNLTSGKEYISQVGWIQKRPYNNSWQVRKFADKLKDIVCLLIGCTRDQLEDRDFKEKELGEDWWYYKGETGLYPYNTPYEANKKLPLIKLTPRKLLQLLGTECGRQIIHPNIWCLALFNNYLINYIESDFLEMNIDNAKNLGLIE